MMENVISAHQVIKNRQAAIHNQVSDITSEINELEERIKELNLKREQLVVEYDLWDTIDEHNYIKVVQTTTTQVTTHRRLDSKDKMKFDDCLKEIMLEAGRPLAFNEILTRLETFGYKWATYYTAYSFITGRKLVKNAGQRGMYQLTTGQ